MSIFSRLNYMIDAVSLPAFIILFTLAAIVTMEEKGVFRRLEAPAREVSKIVKIIAAPVLMHGFNLATEAHKDVPAQWRVWISLQVGVLAAVSIVSFASLFRLATQDAARSTGNVPLVPCLALGVIAGGATLYAVGGLGLDEWNYALTLPEEGIEAAREVPDLVSQWAGEVWSKVRGA